MNAGCRPHVEVRGRPAHPSRRGVGRRSAPRFPLGASPLRRGQRPLSHAAGGAGRLDRADGSRAVRLGRAAHAPAHGTGTWARGIGAARRRGRRRRLALRPGQRAGALESQRPGRRVRPRGLGWRRRRPAALPPRSRDDRGPGPGGDARESAAQRAARWPRRSGLAGIMADRAGVAQAATRAGGAGCVGLCAAGVVPADRRGGLRLRRALPHGRAPGRERRPALAAFAGPPLGLVANPRAGVVLGRAVCGSASDR